MLEEGGRGSAGSGEGREGEGRLQVPERVDDVVLPSLH